MKWWEGRKKLSTETSRARGWGCGGMCFRLSIRYQLLLTWHKSLKARGHTKSQLVYEGRLILVVDLNLDACFVGCFVCEYRTPENSSHLHYRSLFCWLEAMCWLYVTHCTKTFLVIFTQWRFIIYIMATCNNCWVLIHLTISKCFQRSCSHFLFLKGSLNM